MSETDYKPKFIPWDDEAFYADLDVKLMAPIQRWMYKTLLQASFFCSTRPYLPNDDRVLWMLAGCESKSQWDSHKENVIAAFQKTSIGGRKVLYRKRTLKDWEYLVNEREKKVEMGRKSGEVRRERQFNGGSTTVQPEFDGGLTEVEQEKLRVSEVKRREEEVIDNKPSRVFKQLPVILEKFLGVEPEPLDMGDGRRRKRLRDLTSIYGAGRILDAAEDFAKKNVGTVTRYPIQEFLKVADGILRGVIEVRENPELKQLSAKLYTLGEQPFADKNYSKLGELLKIYPVDEIVGAYTEFVGGRDDFSMKHAPKDFCAGGGESIILARRDRAENERRTRELYEQISERRKVEVDEDFARLQREQEIGDQDLKETFGV